MIPSARSPFRSTVSGIPAIRAARYSFLSAGRHSSPNSFVIRIHLRKSQQTGCFFSPAVISAGRPFVRKCIPYADAMFSRVPRYLSSISRHMAENAST